MRKLRNKKFCLLMALIFAFTTMFSFAGVAAAASTSYDALSTPTVEESDNDTDLKDLGSLLITIDKLDTTKDHEALLSLPSDFEHSFTNGDVLEAEYDGGSVANAVYITTTSKDNEFKIDLSGLAGNGLLSDVEILIPFEDVYVEGDDGDIVLTIEKITGQFVDGEVVIGYISGGDVTVSVVDDETFDDTGVVTIRVKESLAGALGDATDALKFELPDGFVWDMASSGTIPVTRIWGDNIGSLSYTADDEEIEIAGVDTNTASCFEFDLYIEVEDYGAVEEGDIIAKVRGDAGATPNEIVVGKYGDYGVKVTAADAEEVFAGQTDQEIADIDIEETLDGSLIPNRSVFIKLPNYAAWVTEYVPDDSSVLGSFSQVGDNVQLIRAMVNDSGDVTLEDAEIMVEANAPEGDLEVTVYGSAIGEEVTLVVAKVLAPVKVTTDPKDVRIGVKKQETGDVVITETTGGALIEDGILRLALPQGAEFSAVPDSVEVVEGDLQIGNVTERDRFLDIEIERDSDEASSIKISGIKLDVDRTLAEGPIGFKVMGDAVVDADTVDEWSNSTYAAVAVMANCVTPAPGETMKKATFVLGSTTYTVDGVENTMDVAPYAKEGRTYLPLRYVAMALGVDESNILYDGASQTVTLLKGDKVVQVTIGSKTMVVNGATIAMDVAPEAVDGRTMLPFRWIAWAFGATVNWDAATQTVTMEL